MKGDLKNNSRAQAQNERFYQQQGFGGGQNSDTPASKIAINEVSRLVNAIAYEDRLEGGAAIKLASDERAPGSGDGHSLEQHPVTGRWLFHRGNQLWLSAGRRQAEWTEVTSIGTDGTLADSGIFTDGTAAISGAAATYLSNMVLTGVAPSQAFTVDVMNVDGTFFNVKLYSGATLVAQASYQYALTPNTIALNASGGSGINGTVSVAALTAGNTPSSGTILVSEFEVNFSIRGLTLENTDNYQLWWDVVVPYDLSDHGVNIYKDAAKTQLVCSGGSGEGYNTIMFSENGSGVYGVAFSFDNPDADGVYSGTPLTFTVPATDINSKSKIDFLEDFGFVVFISSAVSHNVFVDQRLSEYWLLSTSYGYGNTAMPSRGSGGYAYRYLYTFSRIINPSTGIPASSSNRTSASLQFEGPSAVLPIDVTDYATYSKTGPVSESNPIGVELFDNSDVTLTPLYVNAAAYITHISLYRTLDGGANGDPLAVDQYIWVADVPINSTDYTDTTPDEVLLARIEAGSRAETRYIYALPSRGWREMDRGIGAIRTDFMFTAFQDAASVSYCDVGVIPRLIGYHNPLQRRLLKDPVTHIHATASLMVIASPSATYAITTGINQDLGKGLYYLPVISHIERVSGNVGVAARYKPFSIDDSSFAAFCTDHTIRIFSAMSWGDPLDGVLVHKILKTVTGEARIGYARGALLFWFENRCLRYAFGGNPGARWSEIERSAWPFPVCVATQETDESFLKLTVLDPVTGCFFSVEDEAATYEDEIPAPTINIRGTVSIENIVLSGWDGETLYGSMLFSELQLFLTEADRDGNVDAVGTTSVLSGPGVGIVISGSISGTVDVLSLEDAEFTVSDGVRVGAYSRIDSLVIMRDLTATQEHFEVFHKSSFASMRFPYNMPVPQVRATWYGNGVAKDTNVIVPNNGSIQSYQRVQGNRIQLALEILGSGWQIVGLDTKYQTFDARGADGPWNSPEAAWQAELSQGMLAWLNGLSGLRNRVGGRFIGTAPSASEDPSGRPYGQSFGSPVSFTASKSVTDYTIMFWAKTPVYGPGTLLFSPIAMISAGVPVAYLNFIGPGQAWSAGSAPAGLGGLRSVAWGNGRALAVSDNGSCISTTNGNSWSNITLGASINAREIIYVAALSRWIAIGNSGVVLTSTTGNSGSWTAQISTVTETLFGITWAGSQLIIVGASGRILTSPTGLTGSFTVRTSGTTQQFMSVAWSPGLGLAVAVGANGTMFTSPDGAAWTLRAPVVATGLNRVRFLNGSFIAVGDAGVILTSNNGSAWAQSPSGTTITLRDVTYNGTLLIVIGFTGIALSSTTGAAWFLFSAASSDLLGIGYAPEIGRLLAVGVSGVTRYSESVMALDYGPSSGALPSNPIDGAWHHYALTRDDDGFRVFQDGDQIASSAISPAPTYAVDTVRIGSPTGAQNLFSPRVYESALPPEAVAYYFSHPEEWA